MYSCLLLVSGKLFLLINHSLSRFLNFVDKFKFSNSSWFSACPFILLWGELLYTITTTSTCTTRVWVFAVCQRHTAKGSKHTAKGFTVGRPRRRPNGDRLDGKHALCRVPFIGHTTKASPCVFYDTRRKKEETARRRRNDREWRGGRLRREPN